MTADLDRYLDDLSRWLVGPRRWRRDVVDEVRDGLLEAARRHGDEHTPTSVRLAIAEFGPPSNLGPLLADELRLRSTRRAGAVALLLLTATGLAWQLYRALVGFPATTVPDGPSGQLFAAAVAAVTTAPVVAQIGALTLVLLSHLPRQMTRTRARLLGALANISVAATATTLVAVLVALATIHGSHRGAAAAAGAVTTGALATALGGMRRAALHVRAHAHSDTRNGPHPSG